jgi:peptidyl-tRNA hydrolase
LRVGIGQNGDETAYDYVLDKPTEAERPLLDETVERAKDAVLCWVECGVEVAMNEFNYCGE